MKIDKLKHYYVASWLIPFAFLFIGLIPSLIVVPLALWGFELWQRKTGKGKFEWLDIAFGLRALVQSFFCYIAGKTEFSLLQHIIDSF